MAINAVVLFEAKQAEASNTIQYTANQVSTIIDKFTVTNTTVASVTLSVNLLAPGGAVADANKVISNKSIRPNETYACPELVGHVLKVGGAISTIAGAGASLTIRASGREIS